MQADWIVGPEDRILVTGAAGFIGSRVVRCLLEYGFRRITCFVRTRRPTGELASVLSRFPTEHVRIVEGNLLSRDDCRDAITDATLVYHLAAGSEKTFAGCVANSVVTTRNLLDSLPQHGKFKRFVNVSSFGVYSNFKLRRGALLDENCDLESEHVARNEPYAYAKLKQEQLVRDYGAKRGLPFVMLRPGAVYGPGKPDLTGRIGIDPFGVFLHLGGGNRIPFTYVDNCASAIALAGLVKGADGEVFNVVDDVLPTSTQFFRAYRKHVRPMRYIRIPYRVFYHLSWLWEAYAVRSGGQLPAAFNRRKCAAYWKGNTYSNAKLKQFLNWRPTVSYEDGTRQYFEYLKELHSC